jgi:hypothetical protein
MLVVQAEHAAQRAVGMAQRAGELAAAAEHTVAELQAEAVRRGVQLAEAGERAAVAQRDKERLEAALVTCRQVHAERERARATERERECHSETRSGWRRRW